MINVLAAPTTSFLNNYLWQFLTFIVAIVAVIGFLVFHYYLTPPIARKFISAKWKPGSPSFIQDDAGVVHFTTNNIELPEGVVHNKRGWFLRSRSPYLPGEEPVVKRGPGRPPKEADDKTPDGEVSKEEAEKVLDTVLQAPILEGFGKAVFFGYDGAPLLSNLKTLAVASGNEVSIQTPDDAKNNIVRRIAAHADLRIMKEIIPATISRTQLGNLHRWATAKGYEKRGGDQMKLIYVAIAGAIILGSLGLMVYMIMNGKPPQVIAPGPTP